MVLYGLFYECKLLTIEEEEEEKEKEKEKEKKKKKCLKTTSVKLNIWPIGSEYVARDILYSSLGSLSCND